MLDAGISRRVGVDVSERAIRYARAFHPVIDFRAGAADRLDETFNVVTTVHVLEHIPDAQVAMFLQTLASRARPGGCVIVCVPTKVQPLQLKHYRHYDLALFREQLDASRAPLRIASVEYLCRRTWLTPLRRLLDNRFWLIQDPWVCRLWWRYYWNRVRFASAGNGHHMVVVLEKPGEMP